MRNTRQELAPDAATRTWISAVVEAQHRIRDSGARPGPLLDELVASVSGVADAPTRVAILEDGTLTVRAASWGLQHLIGTAVAIEGTVCGRVLATVQPVRIDDLEQIDSALAVEGCGPGRSALAVPLACNGEGLGVVLLSADEPGWFDESDEQAVVLLAGTAAAALAATRQPPTEPLTLDLPAPVVPPQLERAQRGAGLSEGPIRLAHPQAPDGAPVALPALHGGRPNGAGGEPNRARLGGLQLTGTGGPDGAAANGAPANGAAANGAPANGAAANGAAASRTGSSGRESNGARHSAEPNGSHAGVGHPFSPYMYSPADAMGLLPTPGPGIPMVPPGRHDPAAGGLGLWEWDAASGDFRASQPVRQLLQLADDATLTLAGLGAFIHPEDEDRVADLIDRAAAGERVAGALRLVLPDGEVRRVYGWSETRLTEAGEVAGLWGALVDVTGREQDAEVLRSSLAGLRAAQELTGLGVWEWRPDTDELSWSPEMYRIIGLEPGDVSPTLDLWHGCIHPEDLELAQRLDLGWIDPALGDPVVPAGSDGSGAAGAPSGAGRQGAVQTIRVTGADGVERHVQSWSTIAPATEDSPLVVCGAAVDVTSQVRDRELLEQLNETDAVTGLGNRLAFDRRMQECLADPTRDVAVLLLDLDRFKTVNDSLGHQVGDRLLIEVARRLNEVVPEGSTTVRMGGDEFVVVPRPGLGWLQVRRLAQAIVDRLRAPYVLPESGEMLVCPASIGVTSTSGRTVGASDLLREADLALYRAKDSGRDRYVVFDDVLRARAQARHLAERQLRQALEEGRLALEYQPVVDIATGLVVGAEALVRLHDEDGDRLLGPEEFIDVAEDTGLVVEVDCWVIDNAIAQIGLWVQAVGSEDAVPWLAINVSARSMEHPRVARRIMEAVSQGRVPRHRIKVELTEHSFLGALPGGESALRQLLGSGVPVGIDDFGTGYSALAYLQRFDLDFMKIDRSFVAAVGEDERADAVVTAIVDLAHAHGMLVTAEGVETPRQAQRLQEIGCDFAQGFHFGRPGPPARIVHG